MMKEMLPDDFHGLKGWLYMIVFTVAFYLGRYETRILIVSLLCSIYLFFIFLFNARVTATCFKCM